MTLDLRKVAGYCPMGCGSTLFLGDGGHVTCSLISCPRPTAVDDLLEDREVDHVVVFDAAGFTVRHPLSERLDEALLECKLHQVCAEMDGPPPRLGRYRARLVAGAWKWLPLT